MKRFISKGIVILVFLGMLVGVVGGGVMGGVAGYYVALEQASAINTPSTEGASAQTATQASTIGSLSVSADSAITAAVKQAEPAVVTVVSTMQTR